ncbi:hypothetical protein ACFOU2_16025 [Bacillus songklensis]|uniref:Uncharacterized protein n=1 Tax=Bacillus songklensis TaxID=1069116 RepID=A0ABV8B6T4_9BACI
MSTLSIHIRIIYPKMDEQEFIDALERCVKVSITAAAGIAAAEIMAMEAFPPSIPAILPGLFYSAYAAGKKTFFTAMKVNPTLGKMNPSNFKFFLFHEQSSTDEWHPLTRKEALDFLKTLFTHSTGFVLLDQVVPLAAVQKK